MNRVVILLVILAGLIAAQPPSANPPDFRLQVVPAVVYKVDDPGNTGTSSFVFDIAVMCSTDCALSPISASVELSSGRSTVERQEWTHDQLAKIKGMKYRLTPDTPVQAPLRMFTLPEAFDLHFSSACLKRWRLPPPTCGYTSQTRRVVERNRC